MTPSGPTIGGRARFLRNSCRSELAAERPMPLLETRGLSKRFPGIVALDEVDFEADAGEGRAVVPPTAGETPPAGQPVASASPRDAHELGINIVFQEFSSTPELTVAEN